MSIQLLMKTGVLSLCILLAACGGEDPGKNGPGDTASNRADRTQIDERSSVPNIGDTGSLSTPGTSPAMAALTDANMLAIMKASNESEIAEGNLARQKGSDKKVKDFGMMLVDHHTRMLREGDALASSMNITPELPTGDTSKAAMDKALQTLGALSGRAFDSAFVMHEIRAHEWTLDALNRMQVQTRSDSLKTLIGNAIEVVEDHLDHARSMRSEYGGR